MPTGSASRSQPASRRTCSLVVRIRNCRNFLRRPSDLHSGPVLRYRGVRRVLRRPYEILIGPALLHGGSHLPPRGETCELGRTGQIRSSFPGIAPTGCASRSKPSFGLSCFRVARVRRCGYFIRRPCEFPLGPVLRFVVPEERSANCRGTRACLARLFRSYHCCNPLMPSASRWGASRSKDLPRHLCDLICPLPGFSDECRCPVPISVGAITLAT